MLDFEWESSLAQRSEKRLVQGWENGWENESDYELEQMSVQKWDQT